RHVSFWIPQATHSRSGRREPAGRPRNCGRTTSNEASHGDSDMTHRILFLQLAALALVTTCAHAATVGERNCKTAVSVGTDDPAAGDALAPQIAFDAKGSARAVWFQLDGTTGINRVFSNRYTAVAGWGEAAAIDSGDGESTGPQIAANATGDGVTAWTQNDSS